jgi:hypothetical protein
MKLLQDSCEDVKADTYSLAFILVSSGEEGVEISQRIAASLLEIKVVQDFFFIDEVA